MSIRWNIPILFMITIIASGGFATVVGRTVAKAVPCGLTINELITHYLEVRF